MSSEKKSVSRLLKLAVCLALCFAALLCARTFCSAQELSDYDYYIENYDVQVVANKDRSYDITETIDVYFNIESHGIFRDITTWSTNERLIDLRDLRVVGDPYEETGYGSVRIGDADVEIIGPHTYTIEYTLWHYADEEPDFDYLYLNLIGTEWDNTPIVNATATVRLPDGVEVDQIWLRGGLYGGTDETLADYTLKDGVISVQSNRQLEPNEGLTIDVQMNEGAFSEAEIWQPDFTVHKITNDASLDEYGVLTVRESYDLTVNKLSSYYRNFYGLSDDSECELTRAYLSDGTELAVEGESYFSVDFYDSKYLGQRLTLTVEYERRFDVSEDQTSLEFTHDLAERTRDWLVEELEGTLALPFTVGEVRMGSGSDGSPDNYDVTVEGNTVHVREKEPIDGSAQVVVQVTDAAFLRRASVFDVIVPAISVAALLAVSFFAFFRKNRTLVPVPEFYPPEGMNPAEMGYFIDSTIDAKDVVTLIYDWAAKGYLTIEMKGKKDFVLHKVRNLPTTARSYERKMFNGLWGKGDGANVTSDELNCKFYTYVNDAVSAIKKLFTGTNAIDDKRSVVFANLTGCLLPVLLIVATIVALASRGFDFVFEVMGIICVLGVLASVLFSVSRLYKNRFKGGWDWKRILSAAWIAVRLALVALMVIGMLGGRALSVPAAVITAACLCLIVLIAPMIRRRTKLGDTLLERALGFKQFLTVAERSQLEAMLEQNPNYYYDILPYAQVLGVSKIWEKKFEGLTIPEPTWVNGGFSDAYMFSRMTSSLTSSMTSRPADSGGGSFGGGGGGSFSGGGFSGGGSGGGGGGRW